jgi:hypothetical protein
MTADVPTVIIIDDDAGVRASIQGLLKSVDLRSEAFATPQEFLESGQTAPLGLLPPDGNFAFGRSLLPDPGCEASRAERSGFSAPTS